MGYNKVQLLRLSNIPKDNFIYPETDFSRNSIYYLFFIHFFFFSNFKKNTKQILKLKCSRCFEFSSKQLNRNVIKSKFKIQKLKKYLILCS